MTRLLVGLLALGSLYAQGADGWKEFSIGPPTRNQSRFGADGIHAAGVPLKRVLARAYGLPEHRIIGPAWIAEERYAITAVPENPENLKPLLQQELTTRFMMLARREQREVAVYVLKKGEGAPPTPVQGAPGKGSGAATMMSGGLEMPQTTLKAFADALADVVTRPVFDETGIDGVFTIKLSFQQGNAASLRKAIRDQLGLELADDRRVVDLVQIDQIQKLKFP